MIRRDLQQHGYTVLPAGGLPLVASEIVSSFREDLARSRMSIHLIGQTTVPFPREVRIDSRDPGELAIDRVNQGNFSRLIWISPGLQVDDSRQQNSLSTCGWIPGFKRDRTCWKLRWKT